MKKYIMLSFQYDYHYVVVEANDIQDAFVKFIDWYGIRYPFDRKDIKNLVAEFDMNKFIKYFENEYGYKVTGIYEVNNTLYEEVKENGTLD